MGDLTLAAAGIASPATHLHLHFHGMSAEDIADVISQGRLAQLPGKEDPRPLS